MVLMDSYGISQHGCELHRTPNVKVRGVPQKVVKRSQQNRFKIANGRRVSLTAVLGKICKPNRMRRRRRRITRDVIKSIWKSVGRFCAANRHFKQASNIAEHDGFKTPFVGGLPRQIQPTIHPPYGPVRIDPLIPPVVRRLS
jgi:hypothetical protein